MEPSQLPKHMATMELLRPLSIVGDTEQFQTGVEAVDATTCPSPRIL
jgi:hypothetical protein